VMGSLSQHAIQLFKKYNPNIVIIDDVNSDENSVDTIGTNLYPLTRMALDRLKADADGPIAFIGGNRLELSSDGSLERVVTDPRTSAYQDWAAINQQDELMKLTSWTIPAGSAAIKELLADTSVKIGGDTSVKIGGLLVASDPLGIGVMKSLQENHIIPGKDLPMISFDGIKLVSFLTPVLTSIWLPKEELGITAIKQVKALITSKRPWSVRTEIPGRLGQGDTYPVQKSK